MRIKFEAHFVFVSINAFRFSQPSRFVLRDLPVAVEYKHGRPKKDEVDEVQLAAQTMCLEEMYAIHIPYGVFFYGELRHRIEVAITDELRNIVRQCARDMHEIFSKAVIPKAKYERHCDKCSLKEICMPTIAKNCTTVDSYLNKHLYT